MLVGHLAAAFGAKTLETRVHLGAAVAAAFALDLLWPILFLLGFERVRVHPGDTAYTNLAFDSYPWSHSLLLATVWSGLAMLVARRVYRSWRIGALLGSLVLSHWVLDFITHRPDLPLWPGGPVVGLGLWNSIAGTFLLEGSLFAGGVWLYLRSSAARDRTGRWALVSLVAITGIVWATQPWSPAPPSATAVGYGALVLWLLPPWARWIEAHRTSTMKRLGLFLCAAFVLASSGACTQTVPALAAQHPLDPLSIEEIRTATHVMKTDERLGSAVFPLITLEAPPKSEVVGWKSGQKIARRARAVAMAGATVFEVVVDLGAAHLISVVERKSVEAPITLTEQSESVKVVLDHPDFREGLKKRGVTDLTKVFCAPFAAGYYGIPEHEGKRLLKVGCFDIRKSTNNLFGWPIERLYALVDLRERKVMRVVDYGVVPINQGEHNFTEAAVGVLRDPQKPTVLVQPAGANFRIDGHQASWGNWKFHARIDGRVGLVISLARWQSQGTSRSVLYEGYLSEMFVPYMDADYGWYSRTYFDTGEYGAGLLASPLKPGIDCPATAHLMPVVLNDDKGEPFTTPNAVCFFERSLGEPAWRHAEGINNTYEGRPRVELVVRMAAQIGNYDYLLDWVFNDAAEIEVRVGATGIDALKGVAAQKMSDTTAAEDTRYGTLVAPGLVAVNHDHYFNFRLDLDIEGPANSFSTDAYERVTLPADSPRRSLYVVKAEIPASEKGARVDTGHAPAKYRVVNEARTNGVGNPVSYELLYANHATFMLDPEDWPAKRAKFLQHDLWVTPYDPAERYAGGDYMFSNSATGGLPVWTDRDRPIRNQDIVLWVNLGMHHLTRAEDLPAMPMIWHSFKLRPHNFFDRNPAIDLRTEFAR